MPDWHLRAATIADLAAAFAIYERYEFGDVPGHTALVVPAYLPHLLETGRVIVAERAGTIVGFAGLATRGAVSFLSDLFVRPDAQSGALGSALLRAILPATGVRCTCSTSDPRALALYIRAGMRPVWPQLLLHRTAQGQRQAEHGPAAAGIAIVEGDLTDPQVAAWEEAIGGRPRPEDCLFWARDQGGMALWFARDHAPIGYAIVRLRGGTVTRPGAITIGPLGVRDIRDAIACTLAAVAWAQGHGDELCLTIPGPHPALAPLLECGFRIADSYTFVTSDLGTFADPQRYSSSGPDLF